jgi:hypothetical protein
MHAALQLLLQASEYALEMQCVNWEFAVDIVSLREVGLTMNDVRWLMLNEYVQHAVEVTDREQDRRVFQANGKRLAVESCFVLTSRGIEFARAVATNSTRIRNGWTHGVGPATPPHANPSGPAWDKDRRALWFGTHLVKQFKVPAPNQELILAAFDEENWPSRIDDPLPAHPAIDSKRRLHDTINSLNRNQKIMLLRFQGDGTGEAICWSALPLVGAEADADVPSTRQVNQTT